MVSLTFVLSSDMIFGKIYTWTTFSKKHKKNFDEKNLNYLKPLSIDILQTENKREVNEHCYCEI